ncbi:hypothetical protein BH23GEM10_BH23GEM10_12630 [soil metagenome]
MDPELRTRAESRLEAAASAHGLTDPRPGYRDRLRWLRENDTAAFEQAISHYETSVLPALAAGDALTAWIDYGNFLAGLSGSVPLSVIDATGRAAPYHPPLPPGSLAMFVPEDTTIPVLVAAAPVEPSPAQQAALQLLTIT